MLLRAVSLFMLLAVLVPSISCADDVLDYQNIGPLQIVERMAKTLVAGSSSERRSVTEEAHELGEKHLVTFGEDDNAVEYFSAAGEAFIPLFWTSKSTVRVRSERILAELINDLAPYVSSADEAQKALVVKLLERYAALMLVAPGNPSSGKLLENIRQVFEEAGHPFEVVVATTFTSFEGLPNPDPAFGKNEGEKTVAVATPRRPPMTPAEVVASLAPPDPEAKSTKSKGAPQVKPPKKPQKAERVISAAGNQPPPRTVSAKRVSAKSRSDAAGGTATRVSASGVSGVSGAVGKGMGPTVVVSAKGAKPGRSTSLRGTSTVSARTVYSESGSPAALRILNEQLQSENEGRLLSAFGLAKGLYANIKYSARAGVGADRETAENITVRARMLVGSPTLSVQKAAISMVAELDDQRSVGQLIRLLPEKKGGLADLALAALKKLSGEDFGYSVEAWNKWHTSR